MRVLFLATKYFGFGGAEAYTRMLARAVSEDGARVDILSFLDGEVADRAGPGRYLGHQGNRSTRWAQARFVGQAVARARGYDLVICSHVAVAPLGLVVSRWFGIPYLVLGYGIEVWGELSARRRSALQRAARVVVVSHFTARMAASVQGVALDRIRVIHPVVDPSLLVHASAPGPRAPSDAGLTLLTVARLSARERYKGFEAVMAALPKVAAAAGSRLRYVIVGEGDDAPRLRAAARERGVSEMVMFAGPARGTADLAAWYRASDIFVMPSVCEQRPDGWAGEGFGIVYIEASAFGRPVVAGQGGGAPEAVQDEVTGVVVDGHAPGSVAAALVRLARDAQLRNRMGEAGRRWVREYFTFDRFRREAGAVVGNLHSAPHRT